jgi:hypothetical protein
VLVADAHTIADPWPLAIGQGDGTKKKKKTISKTEPSGR